jgi:hypothetical protein
MRQLSAILTLTLYNLNELYLARRKNLKTEMSQKSEVDAICGVNGCPDNYAGRPK